MLSSQLTERLRADGYQVGDRRRDTDAEQGNGLDSGEIYMWSANRAEGDWQVEIKRHEPLSTAPGTAIRVELMVDRAEYAATACVGKLLSLQ